MAYSVHQVARLSGVTIKTLYHYHKIGLLTPAHVAENGYRFYGDRELERLQQILFYRELDFSLERIRMALDSEPSRLECLREQRTLLEDRQQRTKNILRTLEEAIVCAEKGVPMEKEKLFTGLNKQQWEETLAEQNQHLEENYKFAVDTENLDADAMNAKAEEAAAFLAHMAKALRQGLAVEDERVVSVIEEHIRFLQQDMEQLDAKGFAAQASFLLSDDFHRQMMETQQRGLGYYIYYAAESYAKRGA